MNLSVDAIMKITNDDTITPVEEPRTNNAMALSTSSQSSQPTFSYAAQAAQSKGAVPKQITKITKPCQDFWTDQIRQIITHHNKGTRIMILMRGVPGSGKSHLAKLLVESMVGPTFMNYKTHILSTDDYFMVRGQYQFDRHNLSFAHTWNQDRAKLTMFQGISPIIIDNTNIEPWEMHPYVLEGVKSGYIIEVVEPTTSWAKKANQLFKKNTHYVPLTTIRRMLDNYVEGITGESLIRSFGLCYPSDMKPPVKRCLPPIDDEKNSPNIESPLQNTTQIEFIPPIPFSEKILQPPLIFVSNADTELNNDDNTSLVCAGNEQLPELNDTKEDVDEQTQEEQAKQKYLLEAQKRLEEIEKFEAEWENGEKWDENEERESTVVSDKPSTPVNTNTATVTPPSTSNVVSASSSKNSSPIINLGSKPPRKQKNKTELDSESSKDVLMKSVNDCKDWRDISLFLPPWVDPNEKPNIVAANEVPVEKTNSSTCVEVGDSNLSGDFKIITAVPRDINEMYVPPEREKIPEKRMFDKSTMTNEGIVMTIHCPQKERHFIAFRKLFKYIERESLRYIFDNCCGDVNWAVENVLGGGATYQLKNIEDGDESDTEDEPDVDPKLPCTCLAKYDIIPHDFKPETVQLTPKSEFTTEASLDSTPQPEKKKRDTTISNENMQLKKQIEQNVVIPDSHYSEHCLKIRKLRRGEYNRNDNAYDQPSTSGTPDIASALDSSNNTVPNDISDDEDGSSSNISESDKIVNINVGRSFIKDLDDMFGRKDMDYPDSIKFNISIPTSLLNEINALWMESLMFQLDDCAKKSAAMVKQDEEFAR